MQNNKTGAMTTSHSASSSAWHCSEAPEAIRGATVIAGLMMTRFPGIRSVVDVGCSIGTFLKSFADLGASVIRGVDAGWVDASRLVIPAEAFTVADLTQPLALPGVRADLAVCLEVAEHLPARRGLGLVAELCALSDMVLFSAAIPGQGGVGHVNEQWQSHWLALFAEQGFRAYDFVRNSLWNNAEVPVWYRQNIMLYSAVPLAEDEAGACVDVVHPEQYLANHYLDVAPGRYFRDKVARGLARFGAGEKG